jgi:hypothetical protein
VTDERQSEQGIGRMKGGCESAKDNAGKSLAGFDRSRRDGRNTRTGGVTTWIKVLQPRRYAFITSESR